MITHCGDTDFVSESSQPSTRPQRRPVTGDYYLLGKFGKLRLTISYYIDSLTIVMFCMVTLIASCIHFYSMGYMHEEEAGGDRP